MLLVAVLVSSSSIDHTQFLPKCDIGQTDFKAKHDTVNPYCQAIKQGKSLQEAYIAWQDYFTEKGQVEKSLCDPYPYEDAVKHGYSHEQAVALVHSLQRDRDMAQSQPYDAWLYCQDIEGVENDTRLAELWQKTHNFLRKVHGKNFAPNAYLDAIVQGASEREAYFTWLKAQVKSSQSIGL